jgi:Rrf2 family cysteine metabolism transcriptional repressor
MIRISTKGRYGTRFMLELALNYGRRPLLLKDVAKKEEISEGYLQHIVDTLKGANLIHSNRVGHGGYTLTRPPSDINLREILSSLEGSIDLAECINKPELCSRAPECPARDVWAEIGKKFSKSLEEITLEDIAKKKKQKGETYFLYEI